MQTQRAAGDLAQSTHALKLHELAEKAGGRNSTVELLIRSGRTREEAQALVSAAAAGNGTALSKALGNAYPRDTAPPSGYQVGANGALTHITGGPADPAVLKAGAEAREGVGTAASRDYEARKRSVAE